MLLWIFYFLKYYKWKYFLNIHLLKRLNKTLIKNYIKYKKFNLSNIYDT